jgi:acyl-CoA thioester hydrolase
MSDYYWPIRVYYEDTDAGGVVYHSQYLNFCERARTEWLGALGFEQDQLAADGILFAVRKLTADYRRPARFNQRLSVTTRLGEARRASLHFEQRIVREPDGELLFTCSVQVACLDTERLKPTAIPAALKERLSHD